MKQTSDWHVTGPLRNAILVDFCYILFWISCMELADVVYDCSVSTWEISGCLRVGF
jgi:hypothetical protein